MHNEWLWKRKVNTPSKAVLPVEICPRVEEKIQTLKVPVVENTFELDKAKQTQATRMTH